MSTRSTPSWARRRPQRTISYSFSNGVSANQQLLVPSAAPGTWYILVYSVSVPSASSFTLTAAGAPDSLERRRARLRPRREVATSLTLTGSGFSTATTVELVRVDQHGLHRRVVSLDTFTQLTATFDLDGVPQGTYTVVVTNPGGQSSQLAAAFTVTAAGMA